MKEIKTNGAGRARGADSATLTLVGHGVRRSIRTKGVWACMRYWFQDSGASNLGRAWCKGECEEAAHQELLGIVVVSSSSI